MSKVSIIIPVYRTEKYLRQCLDSALAQTYGDIEIILIDDGSPDSSGEICDEYASRHSHITVIHKLNEGISKARNDGIGKATGDYLFFLDSDDYMSPDCIANLVKEASTGALPVTGYRLDLESEAKVYTPNQAYGAYATIRDFYNDFARLFATKYNFAWGKLYKSDIIKDNGIRFRDGIALGEDVIFNQDYYKYCEHGVMLVNDNGYYYRQHGTETLSKVFNLHIFEWNEMVYHSIRSRLKESGAYTVQNRRHFLLNVLGNYLYGFRLLALNKHMSHSEKKRCLGIYSRMGIYREAVSEVSSTRRIDDRIFAWLISGGHYSLYLFLESIKYKIRHKK